MTSDATARPTSPLRWHTSSHSDNAGGECVEVALAPGAVHVRDTKDRARSLKPIPARAWTDFLHHALRG
ncbi:DUF397 domain-containing protein [Streptomyces sodiiphilus]|uniref:DUF397 domain-containing protein n=1 Tax=Streptomyces sodiiphilus TaxID=226217 RepID=UPI0031E171BE